MTEKRRLLLELKMRHSNLMNTFRFCKSGINIEQHIENIPKIVKIQLKTQEKITKQLNFPFPQSHYDEHNSICAQIDDLIGKHRNGFVDSNSFIDKIEMLYVGHNFGYDLEHYDRMCKEFDFTNLS